MRRLNILVLCIGLLVIGGVGSAGAASIVINNGLAPPNPANVIDDGTYSTDYVYVRNVGCPPGWPAGAATDPCPSPGDPTEVSLVDGGVGRTLVAQDSSAVTMSGGEATGGLVAVDSSTITLSGGKVASGLHAYDSSTATMSGGVAEHLGAYDSASLVTSGGVVMGKAEARQNSSVTIAGGMVSRLVESRHNSTVTMAGGSVEELVIAFESSTLLISGGSIGNVFVEDNSSATMTGGVVGGIATAGSATVTVGLVSVGKLTDGFDSGSATTSDASVGRIYSYDSSTVILNGVSMEQPLKAWDSSTVTLNGVSLSRSVVASGSASVTMSDVSLEGRLFAQDSAIITIVGSDFAVDGTPVPYGNVTAVTGTLTGTLASGHSLSSVFFQGDFDGWYTGTIRLVPPPSTPIEIDIMPGSDTNPIDPLSPGLITVALLGSDTFDVADVDVTTLAFGPDGAAPAFDLTNPLIYQLSHWDVNGDGRMDLLSFYYTAETGIAVGDTQACLTGETLDGAPLAGCDAITTEPACGLGAELALLLPPLLWFWRRRRRMS